MRSKVEKRV